MGAFPTTNIYFFPISEALSILAAALVVPFLLAASATSLSDIKHTALTESLSNAFLFIPASAIFVSVTISVPAFIALIISSAAF